MLNTNENTTNVSDERKYGFLTSDEIKTNVHKTLLATLDLGQASSMDRDELYRQCSARVDVLLNEQQVPLSANDKEQLLQEVLDEIFGLGPIETFLRDDSISDILINGSKSIYIERFGVLEKTPLNFHDDKQLMRVIQRIGTQIGRRIDESSPMLDARLKDGSRVNAIIPPLALDGPIVSIRRFGAVPINMATMIELNTMTQEMAAFLEACVQGRLNIILSGGTGSGKTTLLNVLSKWIPPGERVVTIEDAAELQLQRDHVVRLETRPSNIEGKGQITQRDLLRNALRMRPDRIIIGEVRGAEALDMLQAMNTGHEGSMTTVHANTSRDAFMRVENMVSMAGLNFPIKAIRQQMSSALDLLVQLGRLPGGRRKIMNISEITSMEGDMVLMQDIFRFEQTGIAADGHAQGRMIACGLRPQLLKRIEAQGIKLPEDFFQQRVLVET